MTPTPPPGMWMPTDPSPPLDTAELPNPPEYGSAWTASWRRSSRMGSISSRSWSRNGGGINVVLDGAAIVAHLWSSGNVPNWKWPPYMPIHFVNSNHHWVNIWGRKDKGLMMRSQALSLHWFHWINPFDSISSSRRFGFGECPHALHGALFSRGFPTAVRSFAAVANALLDQTERTGWADVCLSVERSTKVSSTEQRVSSSERVSAASYSLFQLPTEIVGRIRLCR